MAEAVPTCPQCARPVPAGSATCPYDGTALTASKAAAAGRRSKNDWSEPTSLRPPNAPPSNVMVDVDYSAETDRAIDSLIGAQLGDYVVRARLGAGGMGIVYEGEQPLIGKKVAIKVLRPEIAADEKNVARLLAEARAVNAIRHRGIIDIFNFGKLPDGRNYIVMEYLAGEPLDVMMHRRGAVPPVEAIDILNEILSALAAGHGAGIIHRDLKPSNIHIVAEPNGQKYIKILDFGLAKSGMLGAKAMTHTNVVVGTPEYMAPEQARAEPVSPQSDLYALGIIGFELLTGKLPFTANAPFEWMMHQVNTAPPKPSAFKASLPPELDALILKMLAKREADRPASAELIREELAKIRLQLGTDMSGFRAASGHTGPKQALTDEALAAARAARAASTAQQQQQPSAPKAPARTGGPTGPRPAYAPNGAAPPAQQVRPKAEVNHGASTTKAPAAAPQRSDTILSPAITAGMHDSHYRAPSSKIPIIAIVLALLGVAAAGGGYYIYQSSLPVPETPKDDVVVIQPTEPPKKEAAKTEHKVETPVVENAKHEVDSKTDAKSETSAVQVAAQTGDSKKKDPVVRPTRRAVLQSEISQLVAKLQNPANVRAEAGSAELVRTKLKALKSQLADASSDADFDAAEKGLRDIRRQHFR